MGFELYIVYADAVSALPNLNVLLFFDKDSLSMDLDSWSWLNEDCLVLGGQGFCWCGRQVDDDGYQQLLVVY